MKEQKKARFLKTLGIILIIVFLAMMVAIVYKEVEYTNGVEFYRSLRSGGTR